MKDFGGELEDGCKPPQVPWADVLALREVAAERDGMYTGAASDFRLASEAQLGVPFRETVWVYCRSLGDSRKIFPSNLDKTLDFLLHMW